MASTQPRSIESDRYFFSSKQQKQQTIVQFLSNLKDDTGYCKFGGEKEIFNLGVFMRNKLNTQIKQGGSVMCVRTLSSDSAHLQFSLNCLPNEEEMKKINISTYRSTNY